ncbi:shikimate dehydrogenase [Marinicauda algicola]|uniref:Shikimate dehydrogenase (NADP(+)) n=2 Tax=Marinicauda algicola TaxID=2029849 RepID=A0A4S2H1T2_9PROT|nr:shikimate dehydrogenase [Marinicauda algicola]
MRVAAATRGLLPLAGVAGHPVAHSLSPAMMTAWLEASGRPGRYVAFDIAPENFAAAVKALPALGIAGLNITLPHKEAAFALAAEHTEAARAIGAVNLLLASGGTLLGDNTDVDGIRAALDEGAMTRPQGPAVLLGAGGAARAALYVLKTRGWRDVRIVNRSLARARALVEDLGVEAALHPWEKAAEALDGAVLVINATSLGMAGKPPLLLDLSAAATDALVFDMVYVPLETALLRQARETGRRSVDGLSMLIGQARPSFQALFGAPPPQDLPVREILTAMLEART